MKRDQNSLNYMKIVNAVLKNNQDKLDFTNEFLRDRCGIVDVNDEMSFVGPMNIKVLSNFLFAFLLDYDKRKLESGKHIQEGR